MKPKLREFLNAKIEAEEKSKFKFEYLNITEKALRKAQKYAQLVVEEFGPKECMGYLLTDADNDSGIVTDVLLAPNQEVTGTSVEIDGSAVIQAGKEARERGKRVIGWWHSHADFSPFHSSIDDKNTRIVLNQIQSSNYESTVDEVVFDKLTTTVEDDRVIISSQERDLTLVLRNKSATVPDILEVKLKRREYVSYAYSLVVTADSQKTYAEIALKRWCDQCSCEGTESYEVELNIIDGEEEQMREEVKAKVITPKLRRFSWWDKDEDEGEDEDEDEDEEEESLDEISQAVKTRSSLIEVFRSGIASLISWLRKLDHELDGYNQ